MNFNQLQKKEEVKTGLHVKKLFEFKNRAGNRIYEWNGSQINCPSDLRKEEEEYMYIIL